MFAVLGRLVTFEKKWCFCSPYSVISINFYPNRTSCSPYSVPSTASHYCTVIRNPYQTLFKSYFHTIVIRLRSLGVVGQFRTVIFNKSRILSWILGKLSIYTKTFTALRTCNIYSVQYYVNLTNIVSDAFQKLFSYHCHGVAQCRSSITISDP